jgi:hypothetical protein
MSGRAGLADRCWQYVTLRQAEIVPCHERLPIGGVVVLDRREDVRATLTPAQPSLALKALIDRNFGLLEHPGRIFDCFRDIVRGTACRRLTYSDPEEAAALLICEFGDAAAGQGEAIHAGA